MKARYKGICKACGREYAAGADIMRDVHRTSWVHHDCGKAQRGTATVLAGASFRGSPGAYKRKIKRRDGI